MITVNRVGRSSGTVTYQNRCHTLAPSTIAASSVSSPIDCRAARKSSMKVPEVVKIAMMMKAVIAIDGPEIHSQVEMPNRPGWLSAAGASPPPISRWKMPRGSANQFGPWMLSQDSTPLTAPLAENRNSQSTVMATVEVTDGK